MLIGPGTVLGLILFVLALCWTTYVIYLPQLAKAAGIPALWVPWMLAIDQLIFACVDWGSGVYADRALAIMRNLMPILLLVTAISTGAFVLLPWAGALLGSDGFFFLTLTWVVTTSALRAPPMAMLGGYLRSGARSSSVAGLCTLGIALAAAIAPYFASALREVDPRWPFVLAALAVMTSATGLHYFERVTPKGSRQVVETEPWLPSLPMFALLALFLATGFQAQVLNVPSQLSQVLPAPLVERYVPLFWGAFAVCAALASLFSRRVDIRLTLVVVGVLAACGALLASTASTALPIVTGQMVAGGAWGILLTALFMLVLSHAGIGMVGRAAGIVFGALALTAFARIAMTVMGWTGLPVVGERLAWVPSVAWFSAAMLVVLVRSDTTGGTTVRVDRPAR